MSLSLRELEKSLPFPIKVILCDCDSIDLKNTIRELFWNIERKHNKKYVSKIEYIKLFFEGDLDLEDNGFEIYVGRELVYSGKGTSFYFDTFEELTEKFYQSIATITEGILESWHDKIIEIQKENLLKLEQFESEGYDELLYSYYDSRRDLKALHYLKRLAKRYPNAYKTKLLGIYRRGFMYGRKIKAHYKIWEKNFNKKRRNLFGLNF